MRVECFMQITLENNEAKSTAELLACYNKQTEN